MALATSLPYWFWAIANCSTWAQPATKIAGASVNPVAIILAASGVICCSSIKNKIIVNNTTGSKR
jgi:hypothetical protein